ncbi:hypothetical protein [Natronobacterium gregoryi]|nr:hypothetical protein [Natronobacterium gregoryi]AFZ73230.1 hypothetical protein Natgr_2047 [Natronobacterium gregoryi SP2]SFI57914.1 hypothetical protein SAMN05443661_10234 [Natronobacterium gregoryi]
MSDPEKDERRDEASGAGHAGPSPTRWFDAVDTRVLLVGTLLVGVAIGTVAVGGLSVLDDSPPDPEIESVEIVDSGCHEDVRAYSKSSSSGVWVGTINETSKHTEVSAQIRRTSPEDATVAEYRVHVETHNATIESDECPGQTRYRIEYDTPYPDAADALRTERYLDGELRGCGFSTSGPDAGCLQLREDRPVHYSNGTVTHESL